MLARVTAGQVRFGVAGLAADGQGVAAGPRLVLRFRTLDRVVDFLRLASAAGALEDVGADPRVRFARADTTSVREALLFLPTPSVDAGDVLVQAARAAGGGAYSGSTRHFVRWRDARAPLGWDVLQPLDSAQDAVVYDHDGATSFRFESDLGLDRLLLRVPLVRRVGREAGAPPALAFAIVRAGLAGALIGFLQRAGARAAAVRFDESTASTAEPPGSLLVRVEAPTARVWSVLGATPGIEAFVAASDDVAVAQGFAHPVHLELCATLLGRGRLLLFAPPPRGVRIVEPRPRLFAVDDLVKVPRVIADDAPGGGALSPARGEPLATPLLLARGGEAAPPAAVLLPWSRAAWLARLAYALPANAVQTHKVALLEAGILLVASESLEGFPFGTLLARTAPGVLAPLGFRLRPALSPPVLAERLGTQDGSLVVYSAADAAPFRVAASALLPFERRLIGDAAQSSLAPAEVRSVEPAEAAPAPPELRYDDLGILPLWGVPR